MKKMRIFVILLFLCSYMGWGLNILFMEVDEGLSDGVGWILWLIAWIPCVGYSVYMIYYGDLKSVVTKDGCFNTLGSIILLPLLTTIVACAIRWIVLAPIYFIGIYSFNFVEMKTVYEPKLAKVHFINGSNKMNVERAQAILRKMMPHALKKVRKTI